MEHYQQSPQTLVTISHQRTCRPAQKKRHQVTTATLSFSTKLETGDTTSKHIEGCRLAQKPHNLIKLDVQNLIEL